VLAGKDLHVGMTFILLISMFHEQVMLVLCIYLCLLIVTVVFIIPKCHFFALSVILCIFKWLWCLISTY